MSWDSFSGTPPPPPRHYILMFCLVRQHDQAHSIGKEESVTLLAVGE